MTIPKPTFSPGRRGLFAGAVALTLSGTGARAQTGFAMGEVYVNGQRAPLDVTLKPGDQVLTGPDSTMTFAIGSDAFRLRPLTSVTFEGAGSSVVVTGLRILTGALLAVFGRSPAPRQLHTATLTAGIRGTGIYVEANPILTYFCTCYGEVELEYENGRSRQTVRAANHTPNYVFARELQGRVAVAAPLLNHTNEELAVLERLTGRQPVLPVV